MSFVPLTVSFVFYTDIIILLNFFQSFAKIFGRKILPKKAKKKGQKFRSKWLRASLAVSSFETAAISLKPTVIWSLELSELLTLAVHFGRGSVFSLFYLQSFHFLTLRRPKAYFFFGADFLFLNFLVKKIFAKKCDTKKGGFLIEFHLV